jgi:hypothetical protein
MVPIPSICCAGFTPFVRGSDLNTAQGLQANDGVTGIKPFFMVNSG